MNGNVDFASDSWTRVAVARANRQAVSYDEIEERLDQTLSHLRDWRTCNAAVDRESRSELPLVSIIVTAFNCAHTLAQAIYSLVNQTYRNIEILVVDDCSTDSTSDLIARLSNDYSCVKSLRTRTNKGTYVAKNLGLMKAQGKYVTFHDSDDICHPDRITLQARAMEDDPEAVASTCHYCRVDGETGEVVANRGARSRAGLISLMIRWEVIEESVGYFDSVRVNADDEYKSRIKKAHGRKALREVEACLYFALMRVDSLTGSGHTANDIGSRDIRVSLAPVRQRYTENFKNWHAEKDSNVYVGFPLMRRPFVAPASINPYEGREYGKPMLVIETEDERDYVPAIVPMVSRLKQFVEGVAFLRARGAKTDPPSATDEIELADRLGTQCVVMEVCDTNDKTLKELTDRSSTNILCLVDDVEALRSLNRRWLQAALYELIDRRGTGCVVAHAELPILVCCTSQMEVASVRFRDGVHLRHALAKAAVRAGLGVVIC